MNILFVCTGNTCRSPMAETIFNHLMKEKEKPHRAQSAGISVFFEGGAPNQKAIEALRTLYDIQTIPSQSLQVKESLVEWADLVLTMEQMHADILRNNFPQEHEKIRTIYQWATSKEGDISDPFGSDLQTYQDTAKELYQLIQQGIDTHNL